MVAECDPYAAAKKRELGDPLHGILFKLRPAGLLFALER
jgi:hypothetical protein